jgi:hypothetical protein
MMLVKREHVTLVIFGHDGEQWNTSLDNYLLS